MKLEKTAAEILIWENGEDQRKHENIIWNGISIHHERPLSS
jgi:hypothetical protein